LYTRTFKDRKTDLLKTGEALTHLLKTGL